MKEFYPCEYCKEKEFHTHTPEEIKRLKFEKEKARVFMRVFYLFLVGVALVVFRFIVVNGGLD